MKKATTIEEDNYNWKYQKLWDQVSESQLIRKRSWNENEDITKSNIYGFYGCISVFVMNIV